MPFDLSRYGVNVQGYGNFSKALPDVGRNISAYGAMTDERAKYGDSTHVEPEWNGGHEWNAGDSLLSFGAAGGGGKGFQKWSKALGGAGAGGALSSL